MKYYVPSLTRSTIASVSLYLLLILITAPGATATESIEKQMLDVFPPSVATVGNDKQGRTSISLDYTPSTSLWAEG
ncbi:MAG: hypothetical protein HN985_05905, partial [Planctomycetaceae bacterium]|nr:hypothetical protein [Planctomycetaceae bacterium]